MKESIQQEKVICLTFNEKYFTTFVVGKESFNVGPSDNLLSEKQWNGIKDKEWVSYKVKKGIISVKEFEAKETQSLETAVTEPQRRANLLSKLSENDAYSIINPKSETTGLLDILALREIQSIEKRSNVSNWAKDKIELLKKAMKVE
jgi:hypothetical protein